MLNKENISRCFLLVTSFSGIAQERVIFETELVDKISGFWNGQLLGNFMGFPFENLYIEEPIPVLVDRVYTANYSGSPELKINRTDRRGHVPTIVALLGGVLSDDDTDIEFVILHAVEKYGLDLNYTEITKVEKVLFKGGSLIVAKVQ